MTFPIPDPATPRRRWRTEHVEHRPGWPRTDVTVIGPDGQRFEYQRNYAMLRTFEPFRQLGVDGVWREYALVSRKYTASEVMDLATGEIVAVEAVDAGGHGFCPVEFCVLDWWEDDDRDPDTPDDITRPGDKYWRASDEALQGRWGLVAGCVWGDDTSWKVQYLDLSDIAAGVIRRDDRFGYVELPTNVKLRDAVRYQAETDRIELAVAATFARANGILERWSLDGLNRGPASSGTGAEGAQVPA